MRDGTRGGGQNAVVRGELMPKKNDDKDNPCRVDPLTWYYGPLNKKTKSLTFVREVRTSLGTYIQTEQFQIPMRLLRGTLARVARRERGER